MSGSLVGVVAGLRPVPETLGEGGNAPPISAHFTPTSDAVELPERLE
jgi:hypothetical protein